MVDDWIIVVSPIIISSVIAYIIARVQYEQSLELQKQQFEHDLSAQIERYKLEFQKETQSHRDEIFLNKRIEKISALVETIQKLFEKNEFMFLMQKQINKISEEFKNSKTLSETSKNEIISDIMYLAPSNKTYGDYFAEYHGKEADMINIYNNILLQKMIAYDKELIDANLKKSGWSLFITDEKLKKKILDFFEKVDEEMKVHIKALDEDLYKKWNERKTKETDILIKHLSKYLRKCEI